MEVPTESKIKSKEEVWRDRFNSQLASGHSVRAWCKASDTPEHSFYWWRAKLGLSPAKRPSRRSSRPIAFAQVVVQPSTAKAKSFAVDPPVASAVEPLRFRFAGQRELILPASMSLEQVAKLIHAIEGGGEACRATA
jgi:hypothetical protein